MFSIRLRNYAKAGHPGAIAELAVIVLLVLATACNRPTSTPQPTINEAEAIQLAVHIATTSDFHFTGTTQNPTNIQANLTSISAASEKLQAEGLTFGYDSSTYQGSHTVWVVTMEGSWPREFPPLPLSEPTYEPYLKLAVILDANSGKLIALAVP